MERDFNNSDFEVFIKQKADQYKMYPSDRVWKGIYNSLHTGRKWFTLGGGLLLLSGLLFISHEIVFSGARNVSVKTRPVINSATSTSTPATNTRVQKSETATTKTIANEQKRMVAQGSAPQASVSGTQRLPGTVSTASLKPAQIKNLPDVTTAVIIDNPEFNEDNGLVPGDDLDIVSVDEVIITPVNETEAKPHQEINWLQEMAVIKLTSKKKSAFNLQFYFSPTISYRKLADNKNNLNSTQQNTPLASNYFNIDRYVDHKPSIGVELGSNVLFSVGRGLILKSGLQLNYSRYNIKAYKFYFEKASIALNTVGRVADTLTAYTPFRNFSGYSPENLQNQYLQVSMPIGAELKLLGSKRVQLNVAGTIQPTYLLFNDTYLLSTDYVNYARENSLVRKWNVHTSVEAFVSYKMGGVRWQLGPQFRYQLMSSFNDRYPIKEYLMEYGVKLGISKTLK